MSPIRTVPPADHAAFRRSLYGGDVYRTDATDASRELADDVLGLLRAEFGDGDVRAAAAALPNAELFARVGRIRRILYLEPRYHDAVRAVVAARGFDPARTAFDPLRLRTILPRGHENPAAAAVYYAHRDTWYGHPAGIVTWWIPLDDLEPHETFVFYPERFAVPVPNDSEVFDYDEWVAKGWDLKIGWQDPEAAKSARYPGVTAEFDPGPAVGFACRRAENLLFSGAHFHQTLRRATGRARFSLDFRIVHLDDHAAGLAAPNVDDRSRGSALRDYTHPLG